MQRIQVKNDDQIFPLKIITNIGLNYSNICFCTLGPLSAAKFSAIFMVVVGVIPRSVFSIVKVTLRDFFSQSDINFHIQMWFFLNYWNIYLNLKVTVNSSQSWRLLLGGN